MNKCPRNPEEAIKAGAILKDGNYYNQYGVCLDCNGWNLDCGHRNLAEFEGRTVCAHCGIEIK